MKVLFILPFHDDWNRLETTWTPLAAPSAAAALRKKGHQAAIFDRFAMLRRVGYDEKAVDEAMAEVVRSFSPDMAVFETVSESIWDTAGCVKLVKSLRDIFTVAMGPHGSALPSETLQKIAELDAVIEGEPEIPIGMLADGVPRETIPGLWTRSGGPAERPITCDLDALPFPAFDLLDLPFYTRRSLRTVRGHFLSTLTLMTSRGCTNRCVFCSESLELGPGLRFRSIDRSVEDLQRAIANFGVEGIYFRDCDFLADTERTRKMCEAFIQRGISRKIKWAVQVRSDHVDSETTSLMKRAGCVFAELGVEGVRQEELDALGKGIKTEDNSRALEIFRKAGIKTHAYLLGCLPGERLEHLEEKLEWVRRHRPDSFFIGRLRVYPGTALYRQLGESFFENHPWDRSLVDAYFWRCFSDVPEEKRQEWFRSVYKPVRFKGCLSLVVRSNNLLRFAMAARQHLQHKRNMPVSS
ncbi:MAG: B12-binding domain-containing radical SAM protein [Thermovirgaceae bacterium]